MCPYFGYAREQGFPGFTASVRSPVTTSNNGEAVVFFISIRGESMLLIFSLLDPAKNGRVSGVSCGMPVP